MAIPMTWWLAFMGVMFKGDKISEIVIDRQLPAAVFRVIFKDMPFIILLMYAQYYQDKEIVDLAAIAAILSCISIVRSNLTAILQFDAFKEMVTKIFKQCSCHVVEVTKTGENKDEVYCNMILSVTLLVTYVACSVVPVAVVYDHLF
jgi:hypothetical protein